MEWKLLDTGVASAEENMRLDAELLARIGYHEMPILHLYEWIAPSATYGYFTNPAALLNMEEVERQGITLAKRPTGGGVIFHTMDLAFSVVLPASHAGFSTDTLKNYAYINSRVANAVNRFLKGSKQLELEKREEIALRPTFCLVKPTIYDVIADGKKVAGAAQRRTKEGLLHQGSITLALPSLKGLVLPHVIDEMHLNSYPLIKHASPYQLKRARHLLTKFLIDSFFQ